MVADWQNRILGRPNPASAARSWRMASAGTRPCRRPTHGGHPASHHWSCPLPRRSKGWAAAGVCGGIGCGSGLGAPAPCASGWSSRARPERPIRIRRSTPCARPTEPLAATTTAPPSRGGRWVLGELELLKSPQSPTPNRHRRRDDGWQKPAVISRRSCAPW